EKSACALVTAVLRHDARKPPDVSGADRDAEHARHQAESGSESSVGGVWRAHAHDWRQTSIRSGVAGTQFPVLGSGFPVLVRGSWLAGSTVPRSGFSGSQFGFSGSR